MMPVGRAFLARLVLHHDRFTPSGGGTQTTWIDLRTPDAEMASYRRLNDLLRRRVDAEAPHLPLSGWHFDVYDSSGTGPAFVWTYAEGLGELG